MRAFCRLLEDGCPRDMLQKRLRLEVYVACTYCSLLWYRTKSSYNLL
jgi:hypothetical protein